MTTTGTVFANVQNKHSAPGICTLSGDSLFKLYRATRNELYLELIRDIAQCLPQYVSREGRLIQSWEDGPEMPAGWVNERVNMSDWEGKDKVGEVFYGSCWSEVSVLLTYAEIPGIYIQPDTGMYCVFDHIEVLKTERKETKMSLLILNPTDFPATVKMFAESAEDMQQPLGQNSLVDCRIETWGPGESKWIEFNYQ